MSMWLDQKYVGTLSIRLDKFARKSEYLYNFRCPICGDSQTNKNKARGYLFAKKGGMFYKCHNCAASMSLGTLIKQIDPSLYKEYALERYKTGENGNKATHKPTFVFKPVTFTTKNTYPNILTPLSKLPKTHEAWVYALSRGLPENKIVSLFYVNDVSRLTEINPNYKDRITTNEARLVIPFYNSEKELIALSARAISENRIRYITMRVVEDDVTLLYNIENVNMQEKCYVTEGPFDSMFLPNAIAVCSSNLTVALQYVKNCVLIYDNQPRNKEIVREIKSAIAADAMVCIWPSDTKEKDINEMILAGKTQDEIYTTINKNTFRGLEAMINFNKWKKV